MDEGPTIIHLRSPPAFAGAGSEPVEGGRSFPAEPQGKGRCFPGLDRRLSLSHPSSRHCERSEAIQSGLRAPWFASLPSQRRSKEAYGCHGYHRRLDPGSATMEEDYSPHIDTKK